MVNAKAISLLCFAVFFFLFTHQCQAAEESVILSSKPQEYGSFKIEEAAANYVCSYTVAIKTSCSSTRITRDQISLSFSDAHGNQVYAPRLDDPKSRTFERCSTDTFHLSGPCTDRICQLYLYRAGSDGWKPENVKVYAPNSRISTFNFNVFVPYGVWYGFNYCNRYDI
ncbi:hypothetical protein MKW98_007315 [Papaver atlanticum]|uniref:Uncharacterized protein n=1 Tax=Papaver atlanticum TaxID=357466 RepID=A0AAD4XBH4_9MAGN|nr:hypothetical protein MKW98_007315 [Papaver atlanticum]